MYNDLFSCKQTYCILSVESIRYHHNIYAKHTTLEFSFLKLKGDTEPGIAQIRFPQLTPGAEDAFQLQPVEIKKSQ